MFNYEEEGDANTKELKPEENTAFKAEASPHRCASIGTKKF